MNVPDRSLHERPFANASTAANADEAHAHGHPRHVLPSHTVEVRTCGESAQGGEPYAQLVLTTALASRSAFVEHCIDRGVVRSEAEFAVDNALREARGAVAKGVRVETIVAQLVARLTIGAVR